MQHRNEFSARCLFGALLLSALKTSIIISRASCPRGSSNTFSSTVSVSDYLGFVSPIVPYVQPLFRAIWRSFFPFIGTTQRAWACFQSEDMRDEFWEIICSFACPVQPTQPGLGPSLPRGINTIRGRKCGNPQKRVPSLNTNNQRPPNNTKRALLPWLLFYVGARENLLLSSQYLHSASIIWGDNPRYGGLWEVRAEQPATHEEIYECVCSKKTKCKYRKGALRQRTSPVC